MSNVELFHYLLLLICGAGALTWLAERLSIPPAVVLLLGGCVVAVAGKRVPDMDPALLLAAVLPPLLMSSGFYTAWKAFRHELASIASLALGAVAFTTVAVALAVHAFNPALPWAACFTLGAIVSPPDAVAVGFACGQAMCWVLQRLREPMLGIVVTFAMAWGSYGIAEALHGSGVLSVVSCGLVLGVRQHRVFDADMRIKAKATWEAIVFVLDALVFILIGLALHAILAGVHREGAVLMAGLRVALPATAAAIVARIAWVFVAMWLPGRLRAPRAGHAPWSWREAVVLGWSGMRG
ncbi:sodium:proton exchanger, partial [Burkholderia multivorans]|uniref:cation:proton antiporter n=1 Tax=Burkholderia multivorans TaxID=87883 RepID=UPI000DB3B4ED